MTDSLDTLTPGTTFGRYTLGRLLGRGGMGAVYEATHRDLRKRVAIKTLLPETARNATALARFLREGEAVARLRHPNVVDISDVGVEGGVPYLVMEYLEGEDLCAALEREGRLAVPRLVDLMLPILDAVAAAHEEGIVHRDLKPENIFLARARHGELTPKLLDFGISKVADLGGAGPLTGTNVMMGTVFYMSPEQVQNSRDVDGATDQYSLGVILYACAVGQHPFRDVGARDSLYDLLTAIVGGRFSPPRALRPDLPPGFDQVIARAMATRREDRYPSVNALALALVPYASPALRAIWQPRLSLRADTARNGAPPAPSDAPRGGSVGVALDAAQPRVDTLGAVASETSKGRTPARRARLPIVVASVASALVVGVAAMVAMRPPTTPARPTASPTVIAPPPHAEPPVAPPQPQAPAVPTQPAAVAPPTPTREVPPPAPRVASETSPRRNATPTGERVDRRRHREDPAVAPVLIAAPPVQTPPSGGHISW
ncbi:MAG: protein kinase [Polyangiales bacterium]